MTDEERQEQPDEHPQDPAEGAEDAGGSPAAETPGDEEGRERGGPVAGDSETDVQDSDEDAATPDGTN